MLLLRRSRFLLVDTGPDLHAEMFAILVIEEEDRHYFAVFVFPYLDSSVDEAMLDKHVFEVFQFCVDFLLKLGDLYLSVAFLQSLGECLPCFFLQGFLKVIDAIGEDGGCLQLIRRAQDDGCCFSLFHHADGDQTPCVVFEPIRCQADADVLR